MFKKSDQKLAAQTLDPVLRAATIVKLTRARSILLVTSVSISVICLALGFGEPQPPGSALFSVIMQWIVLFKMDADLRLLRVIDLLQKDN